MKQIDPTVRKETKYIAIAVTLGSVLLQAVFLVLGKWDVTVLLGNLLSGDFAVVNFFLMGLTVQNALTKEEKEAKRAVRASQLYRGLLLFAVAALGVLLPCFHNWAVIIPLFFPRLAILCRVLLDKRKSA